VPGILFVVATPLGNLEDLSPRAVATLRAVNRIACEDTRRTRKLLARFEIEVPTLSCHKFNEVERIGALLPRMQAGESIALVSDGGTPGVSDPGAVVVRAALDAGIEVRAIPGPSAAATILSISGISAERYLFEGYLPRRGGERRKRLRELRTITFPVVFFEAPHRILHTLTDLETILPERELVVGRELTKRHETLLRGSATQLKQRLTDEHRGEFALVLTPAPDGVAADAVEPESKRLIASWRAACEASGGDRRAALRRTARESGRKRAELYRLLVELGQIVDE